MSDGVANIRYLPAAIRQLDVATIDALLARASRKVKTQLQRGLGIAAPVGQLIMRELSRIAASAEAQVFAGLLTDPVVNEARRLLGDDADEPSVHQLLGVVEPLIMSFGVEATRLTFASVHDGGATAKTQIAAILHSQDALTLPEWTNLESIMDEDVVGEIAALRDDDVRSPAGSSAGVLQESPAESAAAGSPDDLTTLRRLARDAESAAALLMEQFSRGELGSNEAVGSVLGFQAALARSLVDVTGTAVDLGLDFTPPESLDALDALIEQIASSERSADGRRPVVGALDRFGDLVGEGSGSGTVADLMTEARECRAGVEGGELGPDDPRVETILRLGELIDAVQTDMGADVDAIAEQLHTSLRPELRRHVFAVVAGRVRFGGTEPAEDRGQEGGIEDGGDVAAPSLDPESSRPLEVPGSTIPDADESQVPEAEDAVEDATAPSTSISPSQAEPTAPTTPDRGDGELATDSSPVVVDPARDGESGAGVADRGAAPQADRPPGPPDDLSLARGLRGATVAREKKGSNGIAPRRLVAEALDQRRLALAYWIARAAACAPARQDALKALALASVMRSSTGAATGEFNSVADSLISEVPGAERVDQIMAFSAGIRAALVAPYSVAPSLLRELVPAINAAAGCRTLAEAVVRASERGVDLAADALRAVRDLSGIEDDLEDIRERARIALEQGPQRRVKYDRASRVWWSWIGESGPLGELVLKVRDDRRGLLNDIEQQVVDLRKVGMLERLIDRTDADLRGSSKTAEIEAGARRKLIEWGHEALDLVSEWIDVIRALEERDRPDAQSGWRQEPLDELRRVFSEQISAVEAEFQAGIQDEVEQAYIQAALEQVQAIASLLIDGQALPARREITPERVLNEELLKAVPLPMNGYRPTREPNVDELRPLLEGRDHDEAFRLRTQNGDHDVTTLILDLIGEDDPIHAQELFEAREKALIRDRAVVAELYDAARTELTTARRHGYLDEEYSNSFERRLEGLTVDERDDIGVLRLEIDRFRDELASERQAAIERFLSDVTDALGERPDLTDERRRILGVATEGDLATAEELLRLAERGEPLPRRDVVRDRFQEFFPAFVESMQDLRLDASVVGAARDRAEWGPVSFAGLAEEQSELAVRALESWLTLSRREEREGVLATLRPVLSLLGFETLKMEVERGDVGGPGYDWFIARNASRLGRAMIPQYGSGSAGTYRLLLLHGGMTEDKVLDIVNRASSEPPIIALYFGTAPVSMRIRLADEARPARRNRSMALVDDAVIAYLASTGGGQFTATMRLTLPFTALNPFTPFVAGNVPREMFYGRDREIDLVMQRQGTSFIYGGRQLGKSALLREAAQRFRERDPDTHRAIYVDLKSRGIGAWRRPGDLWNVIAEELRENGIPVAAGEGASAVDRGVREWLAEADRRRILLLLDECDAFLEAEAEAEAEDAFPQVSALKGLMERTERRFKPVFAGLHQVQRFQNIPNQPLSHLGEPISVGPLRPQRAYDLAVQPLEALGYRYASDDLASRVLAYSNYYPSILQLIGNAIVDHSLRRARGQGEPPYVITSADLEKVHAAPDLAAHIRHRFELTINLDPRYQVIAYTVALAAIERGADADLGVYELRERCRGWWNEGFSDLGADEFGSLLDELVGLGILSFTAGRYALRSPNVLRMLGSPDEIEFKLLEADQHELPQRFEADRFRRGVAHDPWRRSPLTELQLSKLLQRRNQYRLLVGSPALALSEAEVAIKEAVEASGRAEFGRRKLSGSRFPESFLQTESEVGHRIVLGDLREASLAVCRSALEQTRTAVSGSRKSTLSVVLLAGVENIVFWRDMVRAQRSQSVAEEAPITGLTRWDDAAVKVWAKDTDLSLRSAESRARLLQVTGGWPVLIDEVARRMDRGKRLLNDVLDETEGWLATAQGATSLVESVGLTRDDELLSMWNLVREWQPLTEEDLISLSELEPDAARDELEILRLLQLVESDDDGRRLICEPTVAEAWRTTQTSA